MSLGFSIETIDNTITVFHLEGQILEHVETINLLHEVDNSLKANKVRIVCNLNELQYLNSVGLSLFIKVMTKIKNKGGKLAITNVSPKIEKLLIITKLDAVFQMYSSVEEAVDSFKVK